MKQCPVCHRDVAIEDAAFCLFCGAELDKKKHVVPEEVKRLLAEADRLKDPVEKHRLLAQAEKDFPGSLEIAQEVLFLGRLHERSSKKLDYSVIKCYLWHMYLTPEAFSAETQNAMRTELVAHPQLQRCLQLAADPDAFMRRYLRRLAGEFVTVFLLGSTHYTKSFFGFRLDTRMGRVLAEPAAQMLGRIHEDEQLEARHRLLFYDALYRAFVTETGGESRWVDALLEKKGYPVPATG